MERKQEIEDQISAALQSAKNMEQAELPFGFSDKVLNKMRSKSRVRIMYNFSPYLRVAAVFVIIIVNVFTLRLFIESQPKQSPAQYVTIKDFVNDYQLSDGNEELITTNKVPGHEQP